MALEAKFIILAWSQGLNITLGSTPSLVNSSVRISDHSYDFIKDHIDLSVKSFGAGGQIVFSLKDEVREVFEEKYSQAQKYIKQHRQEANRKNQRVVEDVEKLNPHEGDGFYRIGLISTLSSIYKFKQKAPSLRSGCRGYDSLEYNYHGEFLTYSELGSRLALLPGNSLNTIAEIDTQIKEVYSEKDMLFQKVLRLVLERQGQASFRASLIEAFSGKCAITGTETIEVLEAAHIIPHSEQGEMDLANGILLRSDLHTLFDRDLVAIHPKTFKLEIAPSLMQSQYAQYKGKVIQPLSNLENITDRLNVRWERFKKRS